MERVNERLFRQVAKKIPKKFTTSDLDVLSFGALLYEMCTGQALKNRSQLDTFTINTATKEIYEVLCLHEFMIS